MKESKPRRRWKARENGRHRVRFAQDGAFTWRLRITSPEHSEPELSHPNKRRRSPSSTTTATRRLYSCLNPSFRKPRRPSGGYISRRIATNRNLSDLAKHPNGPGRGVLACLERRPPDESRSVRQANHRLYEQFTQRAQNTSTDIDRTVPNPVDHRLLTSKTLKHG